jgi:hypothetical protein
MYAMWRLMSGIVALIAGTLIYLGGRGYSHPVSRLFIRFGFAEEVQNLSELGSSIYWSEWVLYSLADGLWMFAFLVFILAVWDYKLEGGGKYWVTGAVVMGLFFEFLQIFIPMVGTFDWMDIGCILFAVLTAILLISKSKKYEKVS